MSLDVDVRARRDGFRLDASLHARPGETVALLGPNGAGKSTLVSVLAGLVLPDDGRVALDDWTLDDVAAGLHVEPEARPLGVVFQGLQLFPHLSARENVAFPLRASGVRRAEALARAEALLHELGIADRATAPPRELSGGQAQRVALARALIRRPRMLLLDEPLASLDVAARGRARTLISETLGGFAGVRILVTHDPVEAMTLADRIVVLEAGRVTQSGTPDEVREAPRTSSRGASTHSRTAPDDWSRPTATSSSRGRTTARGRPRPGSSRSFGPPTSRSTWSPRPAPRETSSAGRSPRSRSRATEPGSGPMRSPRSSPT